MFKSSHLNATNEFNTGFDNKETVEVRSKTFAPGMNRDNAENMPGVISFKDYQDSSNKEKSLSNRKSSDIKIDRAHDVKRGRRAQSVNINSQKQHDRRLTDIYGYNIEDSDYMKTPKQDSQENKEEIGKSTGERLYEDYKQSSKTNDLPINPKTSVAAQNETNLNQYVERTATVSDNTNKKNEVTVDNTRQKVSNDNSGNRPASDDQYNVPAQDINSKEHNNETVRQENKNSNDIRANNNQNLNSLPDQAGEKLSSNNNNGQGVYINPYYQPFVYANNEAFRQQPGVEVTPFFQYPHPNFVNHQNFENNKIRTDVAPLHQYPVPMDVAYHNFHRQNARTDIGPLYQYPNPQNVSNDAFIRQKSRTDVYPFGQYPLPQNFTHQDPYRNRTRTDVDPYYNYPVAHQIPFNDFQQPRSQTDVDAFYQYPPSNAHLYTQQLNLQNQSASLNPNIQGLSRNERLDNTETPQSNPHNNIFKEDHVSDNSENTLNNRTPELRQGDQSKEERRKTLNDTGILSDPNKRRSKSPRNKAHTFTHGTTDNNVFYQDSKPGNADLNPRDRTQTDTQTFYQYPLPEERTEYNLNRDRTRTDVDPFYMYPQPRESNAQPANRDRTRTDVDPFYMYPQPRESNAQPGNRDRTRTDVDPFYEYPLPQDLNEEQMRIIRTRTDADPFYSHPQIEPPIERDNRDRTRTDINPFYNNPQAEPPMERDNRNRTRTDVDPFYNYPHADVNLENKEKIKNRNTEMTSSFNFYKKPKSNQVNNQREEFYISSDSAPFNKFDNNRQVHANRNTTLTNQLVIDDQRYSNMSPSNNIYNDGQKTNEPFQTYTDMETNQAKKSVMAKPDLQDDVSRDYSKSEPYRKERHMNDTLTSNSGHTEFDVTKTKINTPNGSMDRCIYSNATEEELFLKKNRLHDDNIYKKNGVIYTPSSTRFNERIGSERYYDIIRSDKNVEIKQKPNIVTKDSVFSKKIVVEPEIINKVNKQGQMMLYKLNNQGIPEELIHQKNVGTDGAYIKRIKTENENNDIEEEIIEEEFFFDRNKDADKLYEIFMDRHDNEANQYVKRLSRNRESIARERKSRCNENLQKKQDHQLEITNDKTNIDEEINTQNVRYDDDIYKKMENKPHAEQMKANQIIDADNIKNRQQRMDEAALKRYKNANGEIYNKKTNNHIEAYMDPYTINSDRYVKYPQQHDQRYDIHEQSQNEAFKKFSLRDDDRIKRRGDISNQIYKKAEENFDDQFKKPNFNQEIVDTKNATGENEIYFKKTKSADLHMKKKPSIHEEEYKRNQASQEGQYRKKKSKNSENYKKKKINVNTETKQPITVNEDIIEKPSQNIPDKAVKVEILPEDSYGRPMKMSVERVRDVQNKNKAEEMVIFSNKNINEKFKKTNPNNKDVEFVNKRKKNAINTPQNIVKVSIDDITFNKERIIIYSEILEIIDKFVVLNKIDHQLSHLVIDQEENEFIVKLAQQTNRPGIIERGTPGTAETFEHKFKILHLSNMEDYQVEYFIKRSNLIRTS